MERKITLKGDIIELVLAHQAALGLSNFSEAGRSLIVLGYRQQNGTHSVTQNLPKLEPEPPPETTETVGAIDDLSGLF